MRVICCGALSLFVALGCQTHTSAVRRYLGGEMYPCPVR